MPQSQLPPPPMLPTGGTPGEDAPQAAKRAWREANAAKQQWYRDAVSQGYSLDEVNQMYSRALNGGQYDPEYGRTREHGGVPMQAMWKQWGQDGGGLPLGYTFDWGKGLMRHDATSDSDPNSPTGNQTWQQIPQQWIQQRQNYQNWVGQHGQQVQQSGGDPYAAYLRQWSDYYKPGFQRPDAPAGGGQPYGSQSYGGGQGYGPQGGYGAQSAGGPYSAQGNPIPKWVNFIPGIGNIVYGGGAIYDAINGDGSGGGNGAMPGGMGSNADLSRMFGNIGDITGELGMQARQDTLNNGLNIGRQWKEYGEGRGMEKYVRDFYGDIMGVEFPEENFSLNDYFKQGMNGSGFGDAPEQSQTYQAGGPGPGRPGQPQGSPVRGFNPDGSPAEGQPPLPPTNPNNGGVVRFNDFAAQGLDPHQMPNGEPDGGGGPILPNGPTVPPGGANQPGVGPVGRPTVHPGDQVPGQPGQYVKPPPLVKVPTGSRYGGMPDMPELPDSGYKMKTSAFNPGDSKSWAMLARPAQEIAAQNDDQQAILKRMLPEGGEKNLASAMALNSGFDRISGLRQNLVSEALSGLSNMAASKKFQVPNLGLSGSGQSLLGNYMQGRGQDMSQSLGLSQIASNERLGSQIPWAQIGQSLGQGLAGMF